MLESQTHSTRRKRSNGSLFWADERGERMGAKKKQRLDISRRPVPCTVECPKGLVDGVGVRVLIPILPYPITRQKDGSRYRPEHPFNTIAGQVMRFHKTKGGNHQHRRASSSPLTPVRTFHRSDNSFDSEASVIRALLTYAC